MTDTRGTDFSGADLRGSRFDRADLVGAVPGGHA